MGHRREGGPFCGVGPCQGRLLISSADEGKEWALVELWGGQEEY